MLRLWEIVFSVLSGFLVYFLLRRYLHGDNKEKNRERVGNIYWFHPNVICLERTFLAFSGALLYFGAEYEFIGLFLFTVAAWMDAIDGLIARECKLETDMGKWLDPLCDKLTYLPALWLFSQKGFLSPPFMVVLTIIELYGQIGARRKLKKQGRSQAAKWPGKTKAVFCFGLVIYCALLDDGLTLHNYANSVLFACIGMAAWSVVAKLRRNK